MPAVAKPIHTAPKDGTRIVARDSRGWREMWWKRDLYEGEFWQDEADSEPEPTHWIDLPATMEEIRGDAPPRGQHDT